MPVQQYARYDLTGEFLRPHGRRRSKLMFSRLSTYHVADFVSRDPPSFRVH